MHETINGRNGDGLFFVFTGLPHWTAGDVYVGANLTGGDPTPLTPEQARGMAAALLRAADEASWAAGVNTYPEVRAGELRPGDVLTPHIDYRGDDATAGAVCESATHTNGPYMTVVWREMATAETITSHIHEREVVHLLRRGPEKPE